MALGVSATMAFLLLFSLVTVAHCGTLQADSATNASSSYRVVVPAEVHAVQDAEGLLHLPSSVAEPDPDRSPVEPVAELDPDRSPVDPVAEPDPDRWNPESDELATNKPCSEGQQGYEKVKEQMDNGDKEEEKEKANRKKVGKKKTKKHHNGDDKGKKKAKKYHRQSDEEDKDEENTKKGIHRHHHVEDESVKKKSKLSHHIKNNSNDDDSDDEEEEEEEKKAKRWRKAIKSRFGHGRRSQREDAEKEKANN